MNWFSYWLGVATLPALGVIILVLLLVAELVSYLFFDASYFADCEVCDGRPHFGNRFRLWCHTTFNREHRAKLPAWQAKYFGGNHE